MLTYHKFLPSRLYLLLSPGSHSRSLDQQFVAEPPQASVSKAATRAIIGSPYISTSARVHALQTPRAGSLFVAGEIHELPSMRLVVYTHIVTGWAATDLGICWRSWESSCGPSSLILRRSLVEPHRPCTWPTAYRLLLDDWWIFGNLVPVLHPWAKSVNEIYA